MLNRPNTLFAVAALACVTLAHPVFAGVEYDFFLVTSFNPSYNLAETYVVDINENNVAIGTDTFGGFLWTEADGKMQTPITGARSINNLGFIAFSIEVYNSNTGEFTPIPSPSAQYPNVSPREINDNMILVGLATHSGPGCEPFNCPYDCGRNFVWNPQNGSYHIDVPNLKAFHAVNNNNVAVGVIIVNCDDNRGVVYDLDTDEMINLSELLPELDLLGIPAQVWPTDINDSGQVIGTALAGFEPEKAFVWSEANGFIFLPTIPGGEYGYMHVNAINNDGAVVGEALDFGASQWKAFVWDAASGIRVLEDLVEEPTDFMLENAYAINDHGWITGSGHFGPGWATQRGYVLKPNDTTPSIPGDLNCDGVVNVRDLLLLLGDWGPCDDCTPEAPEPPGECPADVDGNCTVNVADLLLLLANWQ